MEYTIKELCKKWQCSKRTAMRRVLKAKYKTRKAFILVEQKQEVILVNLEENEK